MIPRSEDPDPYDSLRVGSGAHGARLKNIPQGLKPDAFVTFTARLNSLRKKGWGTRSDTMVSTGRYGMY